MSSENIDSTFEDIEEQFDELLDEEEVVEEEHAAEENGEEGLNGSCAVDGMQDAQENKSEPDETAHLETGVQKSEIQADIEPDDENDVPPQCSEPETTGVRKTVTKEAAQPDEAPDAKPDAKQDTKQDAKLDTKPNAEPKAESKPARKRPAFKKPAAKKTVRDSGDSKGAEKSGLPSDPGAVMSSEKSCEKKTENKTAQDAKPDGEETEQKPKEARVKSDKIPVPRKLKKVAAPPDPCNYTAKKLDDKIIEKKGSKGASKKSKTDELKLPSAKTAYFFFTADQRGPLKSEHSDLSFGEISKKLGEIWNGLSVEEKKPYVDQAEEDKERVEKLIQDNPALLALREEKKSAGKKGAKGCKGKPSKLAGVKEGRVMKTAKKAAFKIHDKKLTNAANAGSDDAENLDPSAGTDEEAQEEERESDHTKGRASKRKANRAIRNEEPESDDEYDWEADHEDCDWAAHPAESIVAVTNKQKYVVKRKGLPFNEFGLVPVNAAKRHCSGHEDEAGASGQLTAEMINDFEQFKKEFSNETVDHTFSRELDLEDLEHGSKLEFCAFLGDLRREGVLAKAGKKLWDFDECTASFSVMTLSFVVQRLVQASVESATKPLLQQIEALQAKKGMRAGMEQETEA